MRDIESLKEATEVLNEFERRTNTLLMIDGTTLDVMLSDPNLENKFLTAATQAPSVCVCRCGPT